MNESTCLESNPYRNKSYCPTVFDEWLCWPTSPPDKMNYQGCPQKPGLITTEYASRYCQLNGTWVTNPKMNNSISTAGYTNYTKCFFPGTLYLFQMCDKIGRDKCKSITQVTRYLEMVGLTVSLTSLIISLIIFYQFRILRNNRTKIHKNLFISTLFHIMTRLVLYIDQMAGDNIQKTAIVHEIWATSLEYTRTTMFMWMFIEGLYLHNMITVTVFQEYSYIKLYIYLGYGLSALMSVTWMMTMIILRSDWYYYYLLPYYWILEGPRSTIVVINLLFLLNIVRVLVVKLRESHTSEIEQVRKAVRAAIFLLPLLGIANLIFLFFHKFDEAWKYALWSYTAHFFASFQGFFVAVLYCFLNGEVQNAIKNSLDSRLSLRSYYTPCRNVTVVSTAPDIRDQRFSNDNSLENNASINPISQEQPETTL